MTTTRPVALPASVGDRILLFLANLIHETWPVLVVGLVAWASIVVCLDPAGNYPNLPEGPGLTIDEVFNVSQGVMLAGQAQALGWLNLIPGTSQEAFRVENGYLPDHPPLGRIWLGFHHQFATWVFPPHGYDGTYFVTACARTGSATAFALTVVLVGLFVLRQHGRASGVLAAISLVLMPRVYGHAHLASLETMTNLTCTAAVLSVAAWWTGPTGPTRQAAVLSGLLLGLALLTKIQAILIPLPVICWACYRWRIKAIMPLMLWAVTAVIVFVACWPYLWTDTIKHVLEYLGRTTNRVTLYVWYFGQKYSDKQVPWHYPFVIFALTVPMLLHAGGIYELVRLLAARMTVARKKRSVTIEQPVSAVAASKELIDFDQLSTDVAAPSLFASDLLVLLCLLFPLSVFASPGIAVYDCERLFLPCFPLWAVFVGRGIVAAVERLREINRSRAFAWGISTALLLQAASPLVLSAPCHLCYYNEVVTWCLGGADHCGLELDYWGVGITRSLLAKAATQLPEGTCLGISPTLHHLQAAEYWRQSPLLRSHQIKTVECDLNASPPPFVIVYRRRADMPDRWNLQEPPHPLATTTVAGQRLAYLIPLQE